MSDRRETDLDLLAATRECDGEAFGAFFRRHRGVVLAFLAPRTPSREVAADLLAETFAAALSAVRDDTRELPDQPLAWLLSIARNKLIDSLRHGRVEQQARVLDERDYEEIAAELRCSEAVVRKRVSRALRTLRTGLEAPE